MANMIFQHTWEKVIAGEKTQTRRIVKPGQRLVEEFYDWPFWHVYDNNDRLVYATYTPLNIATGRYAVMPARGVRGLRKVADIQITRIRREDIREISAEDVTAEGFRAEYPSGAYFGFIETWASMHDPAFKFWYEPRIVDYMWYTSKRQMEQGESCIGSWEHLQNAIKARPADHYQAWVLDFTLIKTYPEAISFAKEILREAR